MSFWRSSRTTGGTSRLLIDIGGTSVAGACAYFALGSPPVLCYDRRAPITTHENEPPEAAMERALELVCDTLEKDGVAALARAAGSGRIDEAIISIDAPWQQTIVHMEEKRSGAPDGQARTFTFTKRTLADILGSSRAAIEEDPGREVKQHVVGIRLNGYETTDPFGKSAHRAALIILISWIQSRIVEAVGTIVRKRFHIHHPTYVSGLTLRYRALSATFPHERDVLILDAVGHAVALSLVRARTLVAVREFPSGEGEAAWVEAVSAALKEIAASYPLPRTILLVADEPEARTHMKTLQSSGFSALWFTEEPLRIIPVSRLPTTNLTIALETIPDIRLSLMTQYASLPHMGD